MRLHVIIIGGGIGGLCLAQGLRKAGVSVALYETGPRRADPHWLQGYQIHVNPSGSIALQECLPPEVWDTLIASACVPNAGFQMLTEQMKEIAFVEPEIMDGTSHVPIVRATLREVLLEGLDDAINFGRNSFVTSEHQTEKWPHSSRMERLAWETCWLAPMGPARMSVSSTCPTPRSSIQGSLVLHADCRSAATAGGTCPNIYSRA